MLVDDMVLAVRAQADEANTEDITNAKILMYLNKAQQRLVHLANRKYSPMFMRELELTGADFESGRSAVTTSNAFAYTVNMVEAIYNGASFKIQPAEVSQMVTYTRRTGAIIPSYYAIQGNRLLLYPSVANASTIRVRYQIRPPQLVMSQGRITNIDDAATGTLFLDELGSELSTGVDSLRAFVNIVDGQTGLVKCTNQIAELDTDAESLTIKTTALDRSTVYGQTVSDAIASDVALDDYITPANGTCIPTLVRDYTDFLIQFAVLEVKRSMGETDATQSDYAALKEMEEDVQLMWSGRPSSMRVSGPSLHWGWRNITTYRYR